MNPKKLLIVSDYYIPHWTGIVKTLTYLIRVWKDSNEISVLTTQHTQSLPSQETRDNVTIYRSPTIFRLSRTHISLHLLAHAVTLIKKADIVLINSPCTYMLPISIVARIFHKKLFVFHQGDLTLPKKFGNVILQSIFDVSFYMSCLLANKVFCATEDYAKHSRILPQFLYKFSEMPIPYSPLTTKKTTKNKALLHALELKKQGYTVFGYAGRFVEEKGVDILLQAIQLIHKDKLKFHFILAGEFNQSYEKTLENNQTILNQLQNSISITGLLNEDDLKNFYEIIDCIVIPSRSDCFPTVQIEAMMNEKPAIVTDIPGARIPVRSTGFGLIIPTENSSALAIALQKFLRSRNTIIKYTPQARSLFNFKINSEKARKNIEV